MGSVSSLDREGVKSIMNSFFNLHKDFSRIFELFTNRELGMIAEFANFYLRYYVSVKFMPGTKVAVRVKTSTRGVRKRCMGTVKQLCRTRARIILDDNFSTRCTVRFLGLSEPGGIADADFEENDSESESGSGSDSEKEQEEEGKRIKKRKRTRRRKDQGDTFDFDKKRIPYIRRKIYKREAQVLTQIKTEVHVPFQMSKYLCHFPSEKCVQKEISSSLLNVSKHQLLQEARYQKEKEEKYQKQLEEYKKGKCNKTQVLWIPTPKDSTMHFVYIREGHHAIKWYPRENESLAMLCAPLRDRLWIPNSMEILFAQDNQHQVSIPSTSSQGVIVPRAYSILDLTTLGMNLPFGSLIDIKLPFGAYSRWTWEHSLKKL